MRAPPSAVATPAANGPAAARPASLLRRSCGRNLQGYLLLPSLLFLLPFTVWPASEPVEFPVSGTRSALRSMNFARRLDRLRTNAVLLIVCAVWVLPLVWAAGTALRPSNLSVGTGWLWLPGSPTFENFADAWDAAPFVTYYANTIVICTGILLVQLVTVTLGGYAFARVRFRGREWMFAVFLLQLLLPLPVLAEPNFLTMRDLHLIDNKLAIMLPYMASGFGVFLMRQAYRSVPIELEEAAVLDGCRWWQLLAYVYIPPTRPGLVAFSIVSITFHWNDFLWPLLVTNTPAARPLTVGLASFASAGENGAQFPLIMAGALLVMAPVLIGFLVFQRHFVASFVQSGFK